MATKIPISCWARSLGDCRGKKSAEHIYSQAMFADGDTINVHGPPWTKGEPKLIGLSALTRKILCVSHNSLLSPLDTAGGKITQAMRRCLQRTHQCFSRKASQFVPIRYSIDGKLFERWLLKTLINLCCGDPVYIGEHSATLGMPDDKVVRICFGLEDFSGKAGLYLTAHTGQTIRSELIVIPIPFVDQNNRIIGAGFNFLGYLFYLSLLESELSEQFFDGVGYVGPQAIFTGTRPSWHPTNIEWKIGDRLCSKIHFNW